MTPCLTIAVIAGPVQQHDLQQADAEDLTQADTTSDDSSVSDEESEDPGEAEDPDFDPRHPDGETACTSIYALRVAGLAGMAACAAGI